MRGVALPLCLLVLGATDCRRTAPLAKPVPGRQPVAALPDVPVPAPAATSERTAGCVEQLAQDFLVQAHLKGQAMTNPRAQLEWWHALQTSIRYRTEQYGYYSGYGSRAWNRRSLAGQMRTVKFAGLSVRLHERILPALRCTEQAIERDCGEHPYRPRTLAGVRDKNTYFGGDVTNHVYGIALDIDPSDNPCCNCVEPWRSNPRCRGTKTDLERMAMPACWIGAFERYGFYWLGHDELKDTMHFEFLGDPAKISGPE